MEYTKNDIDSLLGTLEEFNLEGTVDINVSDFVGNTTKEDIDRDLRMAKIFVFYGLSNRRIISIEGKRELAYDEIYITLSDRNVLRFVGEKYRTRKTKEMGLSLVHINSKTGDEIELMEEDKIGISWQSFKWMKGELGIHYVPPVMTALVIIASYIKDDLENVMHKMGYKIIRKC